VNPHSLARHLQVNRYGLFLLTGAVRPAPGLPVVPREGYRLESFRDPNTRVRIPMLSAAVSAEKLLELFLDLLEPLGELVHVVLETSHDTGGDAHLDLQRSHIDRPVLASHFCEFEDLLLNDGFTGVGVIAADRHVEVQLDEHKQVYVYGRDLVPFRRIFRWYGMQRIDDLTLLSEAEHLHHGEPWHAADFRQLCYRIGAGDLESVLSDEGWAG
jgi:hypothetical protein